jgi:hypothetical protein
VPLIGIAPGVGRGWRSKGLPQRELEPKELEELEDEEAGDGDEEKMER